VPAGAAPLEVTAAVVADVGPIPSASVALAAAEAPVLGWMVIEREDASPVAALDPNDEGDGRGTGETLASLADPGDDSGEGDDGKAHGPGDPDPDPEPEAA
jgi:hypothetical protein